MQIRTQYKPASKTLPDRVEVTVAGKIHIVQADREAFNMFLTALGQVLETQELSVVGFPELKRKSGNTRHWEVRVTPIP